MRSVRRVMHTGRGEQHQKKWEMSGRGDAGWRGKKSGTIFGGFSNAIFMHKYRNDAGLLAAWKGAVRVRQESKVSVDGTAVPVIQAGGISPILESGELQSRVDVCNVPGELALLVSTEP